jgi:hypothetical protein
MNAMIIFFMVTKTYMFILSLLLNMSYVPGGHLTDPNTTDSNYSGVVSLCSIRNAIAAGDLDNLFMMVGDISSAYLEGFTLEKELS